MSADSPADFDLEIAHVLFMDIVGYSKLLVDEQRDLANELNKTVRATEQFRIAEAADKLIRLPTGDGMALAFFTNPEAPLKCAIEVTEGVKNRPQLQLRMGIHSGPVSGVTDVNDRSNVAGAGINIAQRVMDCSDAGHILLSKRIADDLAHYGRWRPQLHELGEIEVKHGVKIEIVNFYTDGVGNAAVPANVAARRQEKTTASKGEQKSSRAKKRSVQVGLAIAALLVVGAVFLAYRASQKAKPSSDVSAASEKSVAVLPFENLSEEKENAFFADGIQDDVLTSLAKVSDLKVISRTSVSQYRGGGAARNLREIAQALGVENVLEGSVRRVGNRVLVNVQLIDARHDRHLWAERYDRTLADSIGLQGELATEIASALRATLAPEEKLRIETKATKNPQAYELYLKANERNRTASNKEDGIAADQMYAQAIALDPTFALAFARGSMMNSRMYDVGRDPTRKARAQALADEALRLAPTLGEAHLARGLCFSRLDNNYDAALKELAIAAASSPNNTEILDFTGAIFRRQGRWREALANFERAQSLDPRNPYSDATDRDLPGIYIALRDWPAAAAAYRHLIEISPENEPQHVGAETGLAYVEFVRAGDVSAGKEILRKIPAGVDPGGDVTLTRWQFDIWERDFAAADKVLAEYPSEEFPPPARIPKVYYQAITAMARGDAAMAQILFEKAKPHFELRVQNHPDEPRSLAALGRLYAYLGRKEEAIRLSRRAAELVPESKDPAVAAEYLSSLVMVYARTGEAEQAISLIERLLNVPNGLALAELRVNWQLDPLRSNPRFQKILEGPEPKTIY